MDNVADTFDNESMILKAEPEIIYESNIHSISSGNYTLEDVNMGDDMQTNCRRSKRARIRNHRYRTDEDITLSPNGFKSDGKISDEEILRQETLFSTSKKIPASKMYGSQKNGNLRDELGQVLADIGLYNELYHFMKARDITAEALRFMQTRHIDELFKNSNLGIKIIFEHRLRDWQNKNCEVTIESKRRKANNQEEWTNMSQINASKNILSETDFANLSSLLTNAVQQTINMVLQEFKQNCEQQIKDKASKLLLNDEVIPLKKIKHELTDGALTEEEIILPDITPNQIVKPFSNKLVKMPGEVIHSNQSFDVKPSSRLKKRNVNSDITVQEILTSNPSGQLLLDQYTKTCMLTPNQRTEVVRCIVDFYMCNKITLSIANCKEIAEEIIGIFPTECMETYFAQNNKTRPPKGKLWDRYQGCKRSIRKLVALTKNDSSISDIDEALSKTDWSGMEALCSQLKHISNEKELLNKWRESFAFRRHQLQARAFSNWKLYFDEYPFCKQQNYAQFIESDLETLYPNLKFNEFLWDEFLKNFSIFFSNRIKHPKSKLIFDQLVKEENLSTSTDYLGIKVIELLHAVLKPPTNKLQSIEEAQRKFTVEVIDLSDLRKVVIDRKKLCTEDNVQAKPYIAVVGQNKTYSHFSVILDSTGFSCDSYRDALILCFNLYIFFDISFPHESLNVWTFIQKYFFNKPPLVSNPGVETFINDIKVQKRISLDAKNDILGV